MRIAAIERSEEILCALAYGFPQASAIHKVSFSERGMRAHQINTAEYSGGRETIDSSYLLVDSSLMNIVAE